MPIANVTVEELASYLLDRLVARLGESLERSRVTTFEVTVEESPGQGASATRSLSA